MRTLVTALLVTLAVVVAPAAAQTPSDLSGDPLDRGTLLALPSVYRVDVTLHVDGLRTSSEPLIPLPPGSRDILERGTAVAVAPDGWLVTAAHVGDPDQATIARIAYQELRALRGQPHGDDIAKEWVEREGAVPVGARITSITVTPAKAEPGAMDPVAYDALDVRRSSRADLALIRIGAREAPALELDEAASTGTPVVTIGFGRGSTLDGATPDPLEPSVRRGVIRRSGLLGEEGEERQAIAISVPVQQGDSGAPVVDADGRVRGIVTIKTRSGGVAEKATEVRQLLEANGIEPAAGPSADAFRRGMSALWDLDLPEAETGFGAALTAFPRHALAAQERLRVRDLEAGGFSLHAERRRRGILLGVAVLALVAAAACGAALGLRSLRGGRGGVGGQ